MKVIESNTKKISFVENTDEKNNKSIIYDEKTLVKDTGPKFGCRHAQMLLLSLGIVFGFGSRTNLSVAIVAMTDNTTSPNPNVPTYDWTNTSLILSSFFWGYISLQILAGYLGKIYGPKYFLLVSYFLNSCACGLTPLAAEKFGSNGVIFIRIFQGMTQGFLFPSVNVLLGRWVPDQERTTLFSIAMVGASISTIFSSLLTGYISASWWGWPASFYILGGLGVCWCAIWLCFGQNSPASHPRISDQERNYIQESLKQHNNYNLPTPWKKMLTSGPLYALLAANLGNVWGHSILMTEIPTYLSKVMDFDVESNAIISAMPHVLSFIGCMLMGPLSDWLISRKTLSVKNARRSFHLIGAYGQAMCLVWLSFLQPSQASWSPFVLGLSYGVASITSVGAAVNHLDISPRFSGVIYGIINTIVQAFSLLGPLSANWIVTDLESVSQWQIVFVIASGFLVVGGTVFFVFMSATRQSWDGSEDPKQKDETRKVSVISILSL